MLSLKHILAASVCVALALSFGCSKKAPSPRIPSDLSLWNQVEIPEPPEIARIPLDGTSEDLLMWWSPDDHRLAYVREAWEGAIFHIHNIETGKTKRIVLDGRVHSFTTEWHPSGQRLLVGIHKDVQTLLEYDVKSGDVRRRFSAEDLGGLATWAKYSADGSKLLVNVYRSLTPLGTEDVTMSGRGVAVLRTVIVAEDSSVDMLALDQESPDVPEWRDDGKGFLYMRRVVQSMSPLGFEIRRKEHQELMYQPLATDSPAVFLDTLPASFSKITTYSSGDEITFVESRLVQSPASYPDAGGELVRYDKQEYSGEHVSRWGLWEYRFSTGKPEMVLDLHALFAQLYDNTSWYSVLCNLHTNPDWCLVGLLPEPSHTGYCWYVSLSADRIVGKLSLDIVSDRYHMVSPSGNRLAYVDDEPAIHVLDLGAVLPKSGGDQAADD